MFATFVHDKMGLDLKKKPNNIIHTLLHFLLSTVNHISDNTSVLKVLPAHVSGILAWFVMGYIRETLVRKEGKL